MGMIAVWLRFRSRINRIKNKLNGNEEQEELSPSKSDREQQIIYRSGKIMDLLDECEKNLLGYIFNHYKEEHLTSIDEINRVIGASQRSVEIQKRLRSDLIGSINSSLRIKWK